MSFRGLARFEVFFEHSQRFCSQPRVFHSDLSVSFYSFYFFSFSHLFFIFFTFFPSVPHRGRDAVKFLQGLTTRDVTCFDPKLRAERRSEGQSKGEVNGVYTAFLNNKGKVSFDAFVMPFDTDGQTAADATDSAAEPDLLLDCDVELKSTIMKHLKMYKLRAKVAISDVSDELSVWSVFPEDASKTESEADPALFHQVFGGHQDDVIVHAMADPRLPALGQRIVVPSGISAVSATSASSGGAPSTSTFEISDVREYTAHRMGLGVAQGTELVARMPLECNLAALNAVSFDKGCYVGQELVARTHYKGKIRKRIMPFQVGGFGDDAVTSAATLLAMLGPESENDVTNLSLRARSVSSKDAQNASDGDHDAVRMSRGKPPARLVALAPSGTVGLAMVRLEALERVGEQGDHVSDLVKPLELELIDDTTQDDSSHSVPVSVHCPPWWPTEYVAE